MEMRGKKRDKRQPVPKRQHWYAGVRSDRILGQFEEWKQRLINGVSRKGVDWSGGR
jgi:hypothetical protein